MGPVRDERNADEPSLDEVVAAYLKAAERGGSGSREEWLTRYPHLAAPLQEYFADLEHIDGYVAPLRAACQVPPQDPEETVKLGPAPSAGTFIQPGELQDYDLLRELGRGGMGVVYEARHRKLGRPVALKMLRGDDAGEDLRRLYQEAELVALLDHPHIVPVYAVGESGGRPFFTMKLIRGTSLAEQLPRFAQDPRAAARLVMTVARAVHHAHQRGVLHRDLKPSNILLDDQGEPHVTDFGLARRLRGDSNLTQSGALVGTPSYMAPEQVAARREAVTTAVDVYGLGAVLYALLTERPPFEGADVLQTLQQVRECEPVPPGQLNRRVERDLETICLKCLRKDPEQRYGSAEALADDLQRYLEGSVIRARRAGRLERAWRWYRRDPTRAGLSAMALAIVLLLALVAGSVWSYRSAQAEKAHDLARAAAGQFQMVGHAVRITARRDDLRGLLRRGGDGLQPFLEETRSSFNKWFTWSGREALVNWFVMDAEGTIRADSFAHSRAVGGNFRQRDYARLLFDPDRPRDAVDVSLVFPSTQDGLYKFAFATRIWDGDRLLGLLAATVPIDARMFALDMHDEPEDAFVACPLDESYQQEATPGPSRHIIVLHRGYDEPGKAPRWVEPEVARRLQAFLDDPSLTRAADHFRGDGSFVDYARVGDTRFVAVVEQTYPWPVRPLARRPWAVGLGGLAILVGVGALAWRRVRRGPATRSSTFI